MKSDTLPRRAYKVAEVAAMWGVSRDAIYDLIEAGDLKYMKVNSLKVIPAQEVQAYEERMTHGGSAHTA